MSGYRMGDRLPALQYALGPCDRLAAEGLATVLALPEEHGTKGVGPHLSEESHVLGVRLPSWTECHPCWYAETLVIFLG